MKTLHNISVLILILIVISAIAYFVKYQTGFDIKFAAGFFAGALYYDGYKPRAK